MVQEHAAQATIFRVLVTSVLFAAAVAGRVAYVSSSPDGSNTTSLLGALKDDNVTSIILLSNISVGHNFDAYVGTGLPVNRNLTVSGGSGLNTVLNLDFVRSAVKLCSSCTWTFDNITVQNDRRGTGGLIDFFVGDLGSRVLMNNVYRLRPACTASADTAVVVQATERSAYWPNPQGPQLFSYKDVDFLGQSFRNSFYLEDFSTDAPAMVQEGRGAVGGYGVRNTNTTRLCRYFVDSECLTRKSSDACVNDLIDKVLTGQVATSSSSGPSTTAIAAGVSVAGGVLLAAALGFMFWRWKRLQRNRQKLPLYKQPSAHSAASASGKDASEPAPSSQPDNGGAGVHSGPNAGMKGWEVSNVLTTPLLQGEDASKIQFGELLGAGSFGRVYKAVWAGREVAVKVIEHESGSTAAVENEVQLMLSFNHPNIVRAYHCVTYTQSGGTSTAAGTSTAGKSIASAVQIVGQGSDSDVAGSSTMSFTSRLRQRSTLFDRAAFLQTSDPSGGIVPSAALPEAAALMSDSAASVPERGSRDSAAAAGSAGDGASAADRSAADAEAATGSPAAAAGASSASTTVLQGSAGSGGGGTTPEGGPSAEAAASGWGAGSSWGQAGTADTSLAVVAGPSKTQRAETWLVQEYCDCGTLGSIAGEWNPSGECEQRMLSRLLLLQDCAQGLKVLHSRHVVHGDLNARNVLVSSSAASPTKLCAKLADLGLSRVIKQHKTHRTTNTVGTMSHMPPELLRYGRMSAAVDIYAFGVMMWEIFTSQPAFKKLHYGQFFETVVLRNLRPMVPAGMPADYQLLMEHCWATDPADRPSIDRVLECLRYMIQERQHTTPASVGVPEGSDAPHSAPALSSVADRVPSLLVRQPQERLVRFKSGPQALSTSSSRSANAVAPGSSGANNVVVEGSSSAWGLLGTSPTDWASSRLGVGLRRGDGSGFGSDKAAVSKDLGTLSSQSDPIYEDGDGDMAHRYDTLQARKSPAVPSGKPYQLTASLTALPKDTGLGSEAAAQGDAGVSGSDRWFV